MITLYVLAFIIASLLYRRRHRHIDMRTVRRLELERYMGRWYEIARYDRPFERRLRNIEARYTLRADGNVEMERAGIDIRTGHRHTSCRHARRTQRSGRLRVKNFIFLHTDYCILELDDQYQWALVGSTAPLRLQILSRQPRIRRDTLLAAIIRGNECIIPGGNDCVRMHDSVIAVTTRFGMQRFDDIFEE